MPEADFQRLFRLLLECRDLKHEIMLKLFFYTAMRAELVGLGAEDVNTQGCKIFINRGKGIRTATSCSLLS